MHSPSILLVQLLALGLFSTVYGASGSLQLKSSTYGMHGACPALELQLAQPRPDEARVTSFELFVNDLPVYSRHPLPPSDNEEPAYTIPWAAEVGRQDYWIKCLLYRDSDSEPEMLELLLPDQEIRYSDVLTHAWLTRRANELLQSWYPDGRYSEVDAFIDAIAEGATHEDALDADNDGDDASERFYRHFYRPTDQSGLQEVPGYPPLVFSCVQDLENSFEWGSGNVSYNLYDWQDALDHYQAGEIWEAWYALGHVAHLVEDASVPAHTHLDIHAVSLSEDIGDDYEDYCEDLLANGGTLPLPAAGEGPICHDQLEHFWVHPGAVFPYNGMASLSYYRNRYPCDLGDTDQAIGPLKDMYPDLDYGYDWLAFEYQWDIDSPDLGNWDWSFGQSCSGDGWSGSMGDDEWWACQSNYGNPDLPGWYYVENTEYVPQQIKTAWFPEQPDLDQFAANSQALTQMEALARDLIPLNIRYVAGLLQFFHDTVHPASEPLAPELEIALIGSELQLSWNPVAGADSFRLEAASEAWGAFTEWVTVPASVSSWEVDTSGPSFWRIQTLGIQCAP